MQNSNICNASRPKTIHNINAIPPEILQNEALNAAIACLPANYNFEIHKTLWQIAKYNVQSVALQFPEGLLMYACAIGEILERFASTRALNVVVLGDVTYGACCIDDFTACALGCDFLVHYGHSCLVPIDVTKIRVLYVFVEISFDVAHLVGCMRANFDANEPLAMLATVQFLSMLHKVRHELTAENAAEKTPPPPFTKLFVPQERPLSAGEMLGCTSPKFAEKCGSFVYVADGRFHLEAVMIANPTLHAFQYDPFTKRMTRHHYDTQRMHAARQAAISQAAAAQTFGLIVGTLGRQSNAKVVSQLTEALQKAQKRTVRVTLSEIYPQKLAMFANVDAWIQTSCPRLSIDWGDAFDKPILTPYEANVLLRNVTWQKTYPMDFYAKNSLGPWTPNHVPNKT